VPSIETDGCRTVPAKFLLRKGAYVSDPTPGGSQDAYFYSGPVGSDKTKGAIANPNNYLVVPANYSEEKARDFAADIAKTAGATDPDTGEAGLSTALARMTEAFSQGGSQDLQRHRQWGVPAGSVVPAFVGSASNHLGYVTAQTGLPAQLAELGGGVLNGLNSLRPHPKPIDTSGSFWLSKQNEANIRRIFGRPRRQTIASTVSTLRRERNRLSSRASSAVASRIGRRRCRGSIPTSRRQRPPGIGRCATSRGKPITHRKVRHFLHNRRLHRHLPTVRFRSTMPISNICGG
jgi:hypothetical protein